MALFEPVQEYVRSNPTQVQKDLSQPGWPYPTTAEQWETDTRLRRVESAVSQISDSISEIAINRVYAPGRIGYPAFSANVPVNMTSLAHTYPVLRNPWNAAMNVIEVTYPVVILGFGIISINVPPTTAGQYVGGQLTFELAKPEPQPNDATARYDYISAPEGYQTTNPLNTAVTLNKNITFQIMSYHQALGPGQYSIRCDCFCLQGSVAHTLTNFNYRAYAFGAPGMPVWKAP